MNHNHNHKYKTRSKRNCYLCSSTQGNHAFPDDLVFNILLFIPAKLLHENMRLPLVLSRITSKFHHLILMVDHPHQHQNLNQNVAFYVNPELPKPPFHSQIRGSYHGLVLLQHVINIDQLHVVNLITKSILSLPSFPLLANPSLRNLDFLWTGVAFSYASSINRYKVVIGIHPNIRQHFHYSRPQVWVCTVGVDQIWRKLELQRIDKIRGTSAPMPFHTPRSVGGFVYWCCLTFPYGCALDVDTEKFYRFATYPRPNTTIPQPIHRTYEIICLQTGLGLVISCKFEFFGPTVLWELYKLTDLKSSKWTKIIDIDVSVIVSQIDKYYQSTNYRTLRPLVYTNDGKLLFLSCYSSVDLFYYHPREDNIVPVSVTRNDRRKFASAYHHVHTLLHC